MNAWLVFAVVNYFITVLFIAADREHDVRAGLPSLCVAIVFTGLWVGGVPG